LLVVVLEVMVVMEPPIFLCHCTSFIGRLELTVQTKVTVGTYTCFASNSVGTGQSTTTTLSVTESRLTSIFALHNGLSFFYTSVPNILYFISAWMLPLKF
jgi:hypothetical protein